MTQIPAQKPGEQISDAVNPSETPDHISANVKAWTQKAIEVSNRMSTDEEYRKEIAKRIR